MLNTFLIHFFNQLNAENLQYAVLRNYENLPTSCGGSDLDLWVAKKDAIRVKKILQHISVNTQCPLVSILQDVQCPKYCFQGTEFGVQIDLFIGVIPCLNDILFTEQEIQNHLTKYNEIAIIDDNFAALIALLKEVLNNGKVADKYIDPILNSNVYTDDYLTALLNHFPDVFVSTLKTAIAKKSIKEEAKKLQQLGIAVFNKRSVLTTLRKLLRITKQPGFTIAFLGTDGSGKSTIIDAITPILNEGFHNGIRYEHMRPNYLSSLAEVTGKKKKDKPRTVCEDPHGSKPSGYVGSLVRVSYYMIDYTWGYFRKIFMDKSVRSHVWFFDRYFYDYINDPLRARINLPHWLLSFFGWFIPSPNLVLCFGTDAEKIHVRKPELPLEEVERQVSQLRIFAQKNKKAVWIDTGCSIEESQKAAMIAIVNMMTKRFQNTKL